MGRILVTGGAGFIGSHLVSELIKRGVSPHDITIIDNFSTGIRQNINHLSIEILGYDLAAVDSKTLSNILSGRNISRVYHIAALARVQPSHENPEKWISNNVKSTTTLLEACRLAGIRDIINASSSTVSYMRPGISFPKRSTSPYSMSKFLGEELCKMYRDLYGMNIVTLRYFSVYGENMDMSAQNSTVISRILLSIINNKPFRLYGTGRHRRDFTHVSDIVDGTIRAMLMVDRLQSCYELGSTNAISIKDLLATCPDLQIMQMASVDEIPNTVSNSGPAHYAFGYKKTYDVLEWLKHQVSENMDYWKIRASYYEN